MGLPRPDLKELLKKDRGHYCDGVESHVSSARSGATAATSS